MARKDTTALLDAPPENALAIAAGSELAPITADDFGGGIQVEGRDETGPTVSRVAMFQGTAEEEAKYGQHKRGVFLDVLEVRELGEEIQIMPLHVKASYARWEKGQKTPVEKWDNKKDVPPDLLVWHGEEKPVVQETLSVLCLVRRNDGTQWILEEFPYVFQFKSTGLKAWNQQVGALEARRGLTRRPPGLYSLSGSDDKNAAGQPFKRLVARPVGDAPADVLAMGKQVFASKQKMEAQIETLSNDEFNPDAH